VSSYALSARDMPAVLLLATDFDGTIASIVPRPDDAAIHPAPAMVLRQCAATPSIVVAIISGRDVDDVRQRIGDLPAIIAGSHGLECRDANGDLLWTTDRVMPDLEIAERMAAAGFHIERKKFSCAIHFRGIDPDLALIEEFKLWANSHGLEVVPGKQVVEARVPGGGKADALRRIAGVVGASRIVFAGDDTTDFDALALAAQQGQAIFIESEERETPAISGLIRVRSIEELADCFSCEAVDAAG
jgi:trehalose-phosphatase